MKWVMLGVGGFFWLIAGLGGGPGGWVAGLLFFGPAIPFFVAYHPPPKRKKPRASGEASAGDGENK